MSAIRCLLLTRFWQSLTFGENFVGTLSGTLPVVLAGLFALYCVALILLVARHRRVGMLLAIWLIVPAGLLLLAATRLNVFEPHYLIAVTPALLLPFAARAMMPLSLVVSDNLVVRSCWFTCYTIVQKQLGKDYCFTHTRRQHEPLDKDRR